MMTQIQHHQIPPAPPVPPVPAPAPPAPAPPVSPTPSGRPTKHQMTTSTSSSSSSSSSLLQSRPASSRSLTAYCHHQLNPIGRWTQPSRSRSTSPRPPSRSPSPHLSPPPPASYPNLSQVPRLRRKSATQTNATTTTQLRTTTTTDRLIHPTDANRLESDSIEEQVDRLPLTSSSSALKLSQSQRPPDLRSTPDRVPSRPISPPGPLSSVKETFHGSLSEDGLDEGQRRLNQYLLVKTIGRGSYGSVELAKDLSSSSSSSGSSSSASDPLRSGVYYAIKEYSKSRIRRRTRVIDHRTRTHRRRPSGPSSPRRPPPTSSSTSFIMTAHDHPSLTPSTQSSEGMELVKAEVAIMKKLSHPNIVSLLEVIDTDQDSLFFVLELCPYGPVMQLSPGKTVEPLSERQAKNVFRQLILGIEYLHFNQVIHRDIKPDNILYFEDPHLVSNPICKIVDFGISESFSRPGDDMMHKSAGSPAFLAPEMCLGIGEGVHGRIADIWAMGVTLYALLCGRLPFEETNPIALCEKIINDSFDLPSHVTPLAADLLARLLNKSPTSRVEMDELRVAPWVTGLGQEPLESQASHLTPIEPPTEREIADAFKSMRTFATMFKAIGKFRANRRGKSTQQTDDSSPHSIVITEDSPTGHSRGHSSPSPFRDGNHKSPPMKFLNQLVDSPMSTCDGLSRSGRSSCTRGTRGTNEPDDRLYQTGSPPADIKGMGSSSSTDGLTLPLKSSPFAARDDNHRPLHERIIISRHPTDEDHLPSINQAIQSLLLDNQSPTHHPAPDPPPSSRPRPLLLDQHQPRSSALQHHLQSSPTSYEFDSR